MKTILANLQRVGGALMLPIAVLPIAGLLLRLGQSDVLNIAPMAAAGDAIFSNLGLLFAMGVAIGLARENHGAAGLASVVGYLVTTKATEVLIAIPPDVLAGLTGPASELAAQAYKAKMLAKLSVPAGIISGLLAGYLYNRFSTISLPSYLAFFGGRRFVPIASGCAGLVVAAAFGLGWPVLEHGMDVLSRSVLDAGNFGLFAFGVLNRVLIVTGLHHIINNLAWFLIGDYNGVTGDLKRFFAGDPTAGAFMAGFFPVMMFGLPAACLAMYHAASPEKRKAVGGLLGSIALTSLLTGVTEPIEFTFMFLAPLLYAVHAVLTGISMVIMNILNVRLGFSFSAGLFDYVLNFSRATHPLVLIPVGLGYFAVYYAVFRYCIVRFNLKTPGREPAAAAGSADVSRPVTRSNRARAFIAALGGAGNLTTIDACTTRLRLGVNDQSRVDVEALKKLGAQGVVRPSASALQVIVGPIADQIAGEIRAGLHAPAAESQLLDALGGAGNIRSVDLAASRVRVTVAKGSAVDEAALQSSGVRGIARLAPDCFHLLIGPAAANVRDSLQSALSAALKVSA
jgi:PTS system N-acetylglucosamine-specific IIC component